MDFLQEVKGLVESSYERSDDDKIRPHRRCKRACLSGGTNNTVSFSWGGGVPFLQVKCMVR